MEDLVVTPGLTIRAADLPWRAVRASGPGGQNVNKVASKVELRFDFEACASLDPSVKARLRRLAAGRLDAEGRILLTAQAHRAQPQNLADARERLAGLLRAALVRPKKRKATRPTKGSKERRLDGKRRRASAKASRRHVSRDD